MFSIEKRKLTNSKGVNIGLEIFLKGELVYGNPSANFLDVKKLVTELESLSLSEVIAINLQNLERWDSLGVTNLLRPVIDINKKLAQRERIPISIIGNKKSDNYLAARDKYPSENDSALLPWHETVGNFLQLAE